MKVQFVEVALALLVPIDPAFAKLGTNLRRNNSMKHNDTNLRKNNSMKQYDSHLRRNNSIKLTDSNLRRNNSIKNCTMGIGIPEI